VHVIPSWLLESLWDQFTSLLPERPICHPAHPLVLGEIIVDGCITKAPGGGQCSGRSPVDRGK